MALIIYLTQWAASQGLDSRQLLAAAAPAMGRSRSGTKPSSFSRRSNSRTPLLRLALSPTILASEIFGDAGETEPLETQYGAPQDHHVLTWFLGRPDRLRCGPPGIGRARRRERGAYCTRAAESGRGSGRRHHHCEAGPIGTRPQNAHQTVAVRHRAFAGAKAAASGASFHGFSLHG